MSAGLDAQLAVRVRPKGMEALSRHRSWRLPASLDDALRAEARRRLMDPADLVREILTQALNRRA